MRAVPALATLAALALVFHGGALGAAAGEAGAAAPPSAAPPRTLAFEIAYAAKVPAPAEGTKRLEVWMPLPYEDDLQQVTRLAVEASGNWAITRDPVYGNRMIHLVREAPTGETTVAWTATVLRTEDAGQGGGAVLDRYLASDARARVDGRAKEVAASLGTDRADAPVRARARRIYDDVLATMAYDKVAPGWGQGDFERACDVRKGNCSDFAAKFIAVARASSIPTRWVSSISVSADHAGCSGCGYHCYAQFREGDRWVPVDPSDARRVLEKDPAKAAWFFGHAEATSVVLSIGRDLELAPRQQAGSLNFFWGPYAEADGKPVEVPPEGRRYASRAVHP